MAGTLDFIVDRCQTAGSRPAVAKALADFDFTSLRRLERTRLLVRFGPALGLMGTLIPLSPALAGLAEGDINQLADNLRIAFSVTVIGLLVGAVAFAMSLVRDRLYGQDHSDLEYAANVLTTPRAAAATAGASGTSAPKPVEPPPTAAERQRPQRPASQQRQPSRFSTFTLPGFKKRGAAPQPPAPAQPAQNPASAPAAPAQPQPPAEPPTAVIPPATATPPAPQQPAADPAQPSQSAADTSPTPSEGTGEKT